MEPEREAREKLTRLAKEISLRGLTWSNMGNVSCRLNNEEVLISPTGCFLGDLKSEDLVRVDLEGKVLSPGKPSSELPLHLKIYRYREDVKWIVHTHSVYLTTLGLIDFSFDYLNPEFEKILGGVVRVPYKAPHSWELGEAVVQRMGKSNLALLEKHGAVVVAADELNALIRAETAEKIAEINLIFKLWQFLKREDKDGRV